MPDEFTKTTRKKFGARGSTTFEQTEKTTDLEELEERVEETAIPFCECGAPILTAVGDVYRCVECNLLTCERCHIELSRYNYCPLCARQAYGLDKRTFLSLVFLDHGLMAADELVHVTTDSTGTVTDVEIDAAAGPMLDHEYLTADGGLSPDGKEALHVGRQLYGDDGDIQTVFEKIRLQEVVNRG